LRKGISPSADGEAGTLSPPPLPPFEKGGRKLYFFTNPLRARQGSEHKNFLLYQGGYEIKKEI